MFALDEPWWAAHLNEVNRDFVGQRFCTNNLPTKYMTTFLNPDKFQAYGNSGAGAISLAVLGEAKRIIMLGFDCQHTGGQAHWHGNHPRGLANAKQIDRWPELFRRLRNDHPETEIINASRVTALDMFPRQDLESALEPLDITHSNRRPSEGMGSLPEMDAQADLFGSSSLDHR